MSHSVTVLAPAKINLFLQVLGKRPDGYHEVFSLMQAVGLYDRISLTLTSSGFSLSCDDPNLPTDSSNLAWRAVELMMRKTNREFCLDMDIRKCIPYGAGLGGGSSDAAAAMKGVRKLYDLEVSNSELADWSSELGSDIPFFFSSGAALASGRGEIIQDFPISAEFHVLLVVPDFQVSTREAYSRLKFPLTNFFPKTDIDTRVSGTEFFKFLNQVGNDFQSVVTATHPDLESCLRVLQRGGAKHAALTGSGSAVFGLFETQPNPELTDAIARGFRWRVYSLSPVRLTDFFLKTVDGYDSGGEHGDYGHSGNAQK